MAASPTSRAANLPHRETPTPRRTATGAAPWFVPTATAQAGDVYAVDAMMVSRAKKGSARRVRRAGLCSMKDATRSGSLFWRRGASRYWCLRRFVWSERRNRASRFRCAGYGLRRPLPPRMVRMLPTSISRLAIATGQRRCSQAAPRSSHRRARCPIRRSAPAIASMGATKQRL
jgi:hypothetical protein